MNIHEYQGKEILARFGVAVPVGYIAFSAKEARDHASKLSTAKKVVKAQIHAGGRGKAGGVKLVDTPEAVEEVAAAMLGKALVTAQTGPEGQVVQRIYVEEASSIAKEYYMSMVLDRSSSRVLCMASQEGGVDIEEVAEHSPEKIIKVIVDPVMGWCSFHGLTLAKGLGLDPSLYRAFGQFASNLYRAFIETDASQVEINPLIRTTDNRLMALDAKFNFDENALFRHPEIAALRDESEEDPLEHRATAAGLNYVKMEGTIGCMVNGAGLAMATMDIIKLHGGEPANFLDVGGGATKERVTEAFRIILSDPQVRGILVNIFGGIMRCDIIADGVIAAARELGLTVPLVVRLAGTNVEQGKALLANSGLRIIPADDLGDAAKKIVAAIAS